MNILDNVNDKFVLVSSLEVGDVCFIEDKSTEDDDETPFGYFMAVSMDHGLVTRKVEKSSTVRVMLDLELDCLTTLPLKMEVLKKGKGTLVIGGVK